MDIIIIYSSFTTQSRFFFLTLTKKLFEKIVQKEKHAGKQHFFPFPTMFSTLPDTFLFSFLININLEAANGLDLKRPIIVMFWQIVQLLLLLVVLGFNATLTAKVISWWSVTCTCFLAFSHQSQH